jgi:CubicO group peptidase (beta-lactamase class C family)
MRTGILVFAALCLVLASLVGCNSSRVEGEIATMLDELAARDGFSGAVLVARDGEPLLEEAYGLASREYDVANQIDTKFNLGSMNKMFTAVAILQLVQQGELAVDDTIIDHVPGYPNQEVADQVTIHHLLTHTSGLGDFFTGEYTMASKSRFRALEDYLPLFVDRPLRFQPGDQRSYSNAGYVVLGLIIEEVAGQSYFDYVRENIYQPCGMANTDAYEADKVVPNLATGYSRSIAADGSLSKNLYFHPARGSSAGGGYSTVGDLLKFSHCLVKHELLSPELTDLLLEGKVDSPGLDEDSQYGYGFRVLTVNGQRIVGHGGGAPGVCSNLDIFLDLGYTVVVLSNSDHDCHYVREEIREILSK